MKFLRDLFDQRRPKFEKGGPLERLFPLFEANETFLFVKPDRTASGAHIRDPMDAKRLMSVVIVALVPCLLFGIYNAGYQHFRALGSTPAFYPAFLHGLILVVPIIIVSYAAGGVWEVLFAVVRRHEINEGFLVTGLLIPLIMPPTVPLWQVAVATSFGVVIGKEIFGGTGMNIFNPALTARAFLFFAFPTSISGDRVWSHVADATKVVDGYSGATPLAVAAGATQEGASNVVGALNNFGPGFADYSLSNLFWGLVPGSIAETSTFCILLGAAVLILTGIGSWRIMLAVFLGGAGMALGLNQLAPGASSFMALPPHYHWVMGGFAFGAVFMATDPVSAASTNTGKWVYGFLIGATAVTIRCLNPAYPEGMMLAILFFNMFAPLIDHFVVQANIRRRQARAMAG